MITQSKGDFAKVCAEVAGDCHVALVKRADPLSSEFGYEVPELENHILVGLGTLLL